MSLQSTAEMPRVMEVILCIYLCTCSP